MARLKLADALQETFDIEADAKRRRKFLTGGKKYRIEEPGRWYARERTPTIITTKADRLSNEDDRKQDESEGTKVTKRGRTQRKIELWANPSAVNWSAPRREANQKTKGGSIRYSWRRRGKNKNQTFYDQLQVQFTFQSGNIFSTPGTMFRPAPIQTSEGPPIPNDLPPIVPPGLDDFYQFLALLNESKLLPDGSENFHIVQHNSPIFPSIHLFGWFLPEGVTWAESADSGWGMQWQATMEVHSTSPSITNAASLQKVFGSGSA